jgi:hypothetical protein
VDLMLQPAIPALKRQMQEEHNFKANPGYRVKFCLKKKKK